MMILRGSYGVLVTFLFMCIFAKSVLSEPLIMCMARTCEQDKLEDEIKNGDAVCSYQDNGYAAVGNKCGHDCMGWKKAEDQTKCFCDACKNTGHDHWEFCKEPNGENIGSKANCDSTVCKGEAKYRGQYCKRD